MFSILSQLLNQIKTTVNIFSKTPHRNSNPASMKSLTIDATSSLPLLTSGTKNRGFSNQVFSVLINSSQKDDDIFLQKFSGTFRITRFSATNTMLEVPAGTRRCMSRPPPQIPRLLYRTYECRGVHGCTRAACASRLRRRRATRTSRMP